MLICWVDVRCWMYSLVSSRTRIPHSTLERLCHTSNPIRRVSSLSFSLSLSLFSEYILSRDLYSLYKARGFADPAVAKQRINEAIEQIAEKRGISMAQVALAWSLSKEYITAPIVGTTSLDKLKDLLGKFCFV